MAKELLEQGGEAGTARYGPFRVMLTEAALAMMETLADSAVVGNSVVPALANKDTMVRNAVARSRPDFDRRWRGGARWIHCAAVERRKVRAGLCCNASFCDCHPITMTLQYNLVLIEHEPVFCSKEL
jgi:hypothetical protein